MRAIWLQKQAHSYAKHQTPANKERQASGRSLYKCMHTLVTKFKSCYKDTYDELHDELCSQPAQSLHPVCRLRASTICLGLLDLHY